MALRDAVVNLDKWHLCILNVFGALAMLTPSPEGGLSSVGFGLGLQPQPLHSGLNADGTKATLNLSVILSHNVSLIRMYTVAKMCYECKMF